MFLTPPLLPLTRDGSRVLTAANDGRLKVLEFGSGQEFLSVDIGESLRLV